MLTPWKESYDQPRQHIEKQRHYFVNKGPSTQGCEGWTIKKAEGRRIDAFELLEKTLESPLDRKKIQPIHP